MLVMFRIVTKTAGGEIARFFDPKTSSPVALAFTAGADHFFETWTDFKKDDGSPARPWMVRMRFDHPVDRGVQPDSLPERAFDLTIGGVEVKGVKLTGARWPLPMQAGEWWIRNRFSNHSTTVDVLFDLKAGDPDAQSVEQFKGVFVRAPDESLKPEPSIFEIETQTGIVKRGGFNAAAAWAFTGPAQIRHSSGKVWRYNVRPATFNAIEPGVDLAPLLVSGARLKLGAGRYTLSRPVIVRDVIVVGAGDATRIDWTGEDLYPGTQSPVTLINANDSAFWDFVIDSTRRYAGSDPTGSERWKLEKERRPRCFELENDCVARGVTVIDFNRCFALNGGKARRLIQGCRFGNTTRTYGVWFEGSDIAIYDNMADNSIFEHICRGGPSNSDVYGWEFVAIDGNIFTNKDNRPADPQDDGKGTIVMQAGRYGYRRLNILNGPGGPSGVGPLSVGAGAPAHQRTTCVVIDNDIVARPVEIWPGAEGVLVLGTPIAPRMPHFLNGFGADPRRIVGLKTDYALSSDQLAVINTPPIAS